MPDKIGSMQYFLLGYTGNILLTFWTLSFAEFKYSDASEFLRKHPWPGRAISDTFDDSTHRRGTVTKKFLTTMKILCGRTGEEEDMYDDDDRDDVLFDVTESQSGAPFYWNQALQENFREELEK